MIMEKSISAPCKLSHKQFRAMLKKFRRKKIRQRLAKEREEKEMLENQSKESSPSYKEIEDERRRHAQLYEEFEEREKVRLHKQWLLREQQAQEEFRRKQERLELERIKREEERKRILEEFEKQEFVEKQAEEEVKKVKSQKEEALQEALSKLTEADGPWHNPLAPENYNVGQEREQCMFFSKTGCCRFGERCSRGHTRPAVSCTILIKGMYSHFSIDQTARDDYDTDIALEYEDKECYQDFKNFYNDVLPEFKKFGKVVQFKVCSNFEPHLRGNVYVQYSREEDAIEAYKNFNGRYYATKQITCEFTHVIRWRSAICGLHSRNLCPKGINCNFLHVFKNPDDEFWEADKDLSRREPRKRDDNEHRSRHDSRRSRYESRSERYESRNSRYESRSDRHGSRSDRSDRYESRSRSERHEHANGGYESKRDKSERYDVRSFKYDRRDDYRSESESDYSEDDDSSKYKKSQKNDKPNSSHRKRDRYSSSRSRSRSPADESNHKRSHKKKKHKKKKSRKSKKEESGTDESTE